MCVSPAAPAAAKEKELARRRRPALIRTSGERIFPFTGSVISNYVTRLAQRRTFPRSILRRSARLCKTYCAAMVTSVSPPSAAFSAPASHHTSQTHAEKPVNPSKISLASCKFFSGRWRESVEVCVSPEGVDSCRQETTSGEPMSVENSQNI